MGIPSFGELVYSVKTMYRKTPQQGIDRRKEEVAKSACGEAETKSVKQQQTLTSQTEIDRA